jgi:diguanylate cyclase (GGDEF)-like protein/PAS domain S-box-containing protein
MGARAGRKGVREQGQDTRLADLAVRQAAIIEALGEIVYDWRPRRNELHWEGDMAGILGYAPGEAGNTTDSWTSRVHPEDLQRVLDEVEQARRAGRHYDLEYRFRHKDGHYVWMRDRGVLFLDDAGQVERIVGIFRDVTARRRAEEDARAQQERILRLSRMRAVMSSVNALIVRSRSRTELFQEACRIAVEQGGFALALMAVPQDNGDIVPVALFGEDAGLAAGLRFRIEERANPAIAAALGSVLAGKPWVRNDLGQQAALPRLAAQTRRLGYGSAVTYPLMVGGQMLACLNLYARERGFFDDEEMALLHELAGDLSYALEFIIKDERLDLLSIYDPLTRLPNRSLFLRRLHGYIEAAQSTGRRLAVLMLDVERFKAINDAVGQEGGDQLLKLVGDRLKFQAGGPSYMARIAGDRFAVVLADLDKDADVEALARSRGWERMEPAFQHGGQEFTVSFKVGIAVHPEDGTNGEALVRNSELALKQAKAAGRSYTRYTADMGDLAMRKLQLGGELRRALERNQLVLHYQPKVDLRSGEICGAEALLRWESADGLVLPSGIVPLMEETGLILDVGRWVLEQALAQRERWVREGLRVPRIAVNVSAMQLREQDFAAAVRSVLRGAPAQDALEVEVTESVMMADPTPNIATLRMLRDMGVTVTMDDFGTGYSSLAYLARLPLNSLKIDRSFVETMGQNTDTMNIVSSIIALAHSMDLRVVAEGVETEEQLRDLRLLRCDELQGYLFSRPLPPAEFQALLASGKKLA